MIGTVDLLLSCRMGNHYLNLEDFLDDWWRLLKEVAKLMVPYARSEVHLTEVMETVCNKMDDYVKATYKTSGELTLLRLVTEDGKMNSLMSEVDIVQDSDLNKSLKFYCEGIVEEYEDNFLKLFAKDVANIDIKLCSDDIHLCSQTEPDDDYEFEDKDEL
uniref:DUF3456 domain-containing protein n=1 Tax=Timema genevievae TaxID=629358 RepID=A0A7R9PJQ4_TIMGE|nr:unnamed protein product [Timema genevievae]